MHRVWTSRNAPLSSLVLMTCFCPGTAIATMRPYVVQVFITMWCIVMCVSFDYGEEDSLPFTFVVVVVCVCVCVCVRVCVYVCVFVGVESMNGICRYSNDCWVRRGFSLFPGRDSP